MGEEKFGYNVQTAVDSKNSLIVDCQVVNEINDLNQLSNMAISAKKVLKKRKLSVVADTGYYNAVEIKKCIDKKITLFIKRAKASSQIDGKRYRKEQFKYDARSDIYVCPEGKNLIFSEYSSKNGLKYKRYKGIECMLCPQKLQCTSAKQARNIQRWVHEDILEDVDNNTFQHPQIYKQRRCVVEHPFGVIKRNLHYTYFLRRGLESVRVLSIIWSACS